MSVTGREMLRRYFGSVCGTIICICGGRERVCMCVRQETQSGSAVISGEKKMREIYVCLTKIYSTTPSDPSACRISPYAYRSHTDTERVGEGRGGAVKNKMKIR